MATFALFNPTKGTTFTLGRLQQEAAVQLRNSGALIRLAEWCWPKNPPEDLFAIWLARGPEDPGGTRHKAPQRPSPPEDGRLPIPAEKP